MVSMAVAIGGAVGGLVLLCLCCGCCVCGFCAMKRKENAKKAAAAAAAAKKKKGKGSKMGSVKSGKGSKGGSPRQGTMDMNSTNMNASMQSMPPVQQFSMPPVQQQQPVQQYMQQPQMMMPPQQITIPMQQQQPQYAQSVVYPSGGATVVGSVAPPPPTPQIVVIRDSDSRSVGDRDRDSRESNYYRNDNRNESRRGSDDNLARELASSLNRLNGTLEKKERESMDFPNSSRRELLDHSSSSRSLGYSPRTPVEDLESQNEVASLALSMNRLNETLEKRDREELQQRIENSRNNKSLADASEFEQQRERNKEALRRTQSSEALKRLGSTGSAAAGRTSVRKTSSTRNHSSLNNSNEVLRLNSLVEGDDKSIGSLTNFEVYTGDEEIGFTAGQSVQSTKSTQSSSVVIGSLGNREIADVHAPPGVLGLILDSPDHGWPVVHDVKEDSVVADQVAVGDRVMSIDGEDVRNLTSVEISNLLNKFSPEERVVTLLRV